MVEGQPFGGRKCVFDAFPGGIVGSTGLTLYATTDLDLLVATTPDDFGLTAERTCQKQHMLGQGTAKREVREVLGAGSIARKIRCGETVNRPGGWSSWPPHKFDKEGAENFEEVFCVFTDPKDGYAIIRKNGVLEELHSGDITEVPLGEHPIVAGPGTRLLYVWFFIGAEKYYPTKAEDLGMYR
jgi:5-deoxy-D-glucuronate isomerase